MRHVWQNDIVWGNRLYIPRRQFYLHSRWLVGIRGSAGIGRRARLRIWCRKASGFESPLPHHLIRTLMLSGCRRFIFPFTSRTKPGGESGIRTHTPHMWRPLFERGTINHSDTPPGFKILIQNIAIRQFCRQTVYLLILLDATSKYKTPCSGNRQNARQVIELELYITPG